MSPKVKIWFSAGELSRLGKQGVAELPTSEPGCTGRAKRFGWETQSVECKGGKEGMRAEYQPSADVLALIHEFLEENPDFFGKEKAPQPIGAARKNTLAPIEGLFEIGSTEPLATGSKMYSALKFEERRKKPDSQPIPPDGFILVPRYDVSAKMGSGSVVHSEQIVDHLAFRAEWVRTELGTSPKNLILISAIGDSMEPELRAGDLLLVDCSVEHVRQDAIYAIALEGELRIKRIQRLFDGTLIIKSDNPSYTPEQLTPIQAEQLRIVGRVVWSGRRM